MSRRPVLSFLFALLAGVLGSSASAAVHTVTNACGGLPGAVGDGVADDTAEIQCHLNAAAASGGRVYVPSGTFRVSATLRINGDKVTVHGDGRASILRSNLANHVVLEIEGRRDIVVRDLYLLEGALANDSSTRSSSTSGGGIGVKGSSDEILIENVRIRGFARGIQHGAFSGTSTNFTLRDVWVEQASVWGIELFNVEKFRMYNVRARNNGSDGIKIGATSRDWEIFGGRAWDNGGNGINVNSGGHRWLIVGTRLDGNAGSGLNVKAINGGTTASAPVSEGTVIGTISERNQKGLEFFSGNPADPLPNHVSVLGGVFRNNEQTGIFVDGRNISLNGVISKNNGQDGIWVRSRSSAVSIVGAQVSANGDGSSGWAGIRIDGDRVRVIGAQINGIDDPASTGEPVGIAKHQHSVLLGTSASDVLIDGSVLRNAFASEVAGNFAGTTIRDTAGWVTQRVGTAVVAAAASEVTIQHGLAIIPDAASISVTPVSSWGNATSWWVDAVTASSFKIRLTRGGGAATAVTFRWEADVSAP